MKNSQNSRSGAMRPCAVRLPAGLHNFLLQKADEQGASVGAVVRDACENFREQLSLSEKLGQLESRIVRKVFEAQCVVAELSPAERDQALRDFKKRLKGGAA